MNIPTILNLSFFLLGVVVGLIYYIDCWKPEVGKADAKNLFKIKSLLYFLSSGVLSGITEYGAAKIGNIENNALPFYIIGFGFSIVVFLFIFPFLIAYAESIIRHNQSIYSKRNILSSFLLRFIKSISQGAVTSINDVEQNEFSKLRSIIQSKDITVREGYSLLNGLLSHLYVVAQENEQRTERSFKILLERYLGLLLQIMFEEHGTLNRYRAAMFYTKNSKSENLDYFVGISKSHQEDYSGNPLSIKKSIGGKSFSSNKIIVYPKQKKPFQSRKHNNRYKSFIAIPIGIDHDVEGILTIDCIDDNHCFNDPSVQEFLIILSSVLHLAGSIYRVE